MSQVSAVGKTTSVPAVSSSASGIANRILGEHKLIALFAKVPGGSETIAIGLKLNKTLSPDELAKLPGVISQIASETGIAVNPNESLAKLMAGSTNSAVVISSSDTGIFKSDKTLPGIVIPNPTTVAILQDQTSVNSLSPTEIAKNILNKHSIDTNTYRINARMKEGSEKYLAIDSLNALPNGLKSKVDTAFSEITSTTGLKIPHKKVDTDSEYFKITHTDI